MSNFEIRISPMSQDNLDDIIEIEKSAYGDHHWSKDSFYAELQNSLARYFCAFDIENNLIGYIGSWLVIDEAHITNLAVNPEHRGKGIGESLLVEVFKECYKNMVKYVTLEVRVSNVAAIGLYEKYLFKSLGIRKGYYQDNNEDASIMWTENIFWDKFKENFNNNILKLSEKITVL